MSKPTIPVARVVQAVVYAVLCVATIAGAFVWFIR